MGKLHGDLYLGFVKPDPTLRNDSYYELGTSEKGWDPSRGFRGSDYLNYFCKEEFERITGISLMPGEVRKVDEIRFVFAEGD